MAAVANLILTEIENQLEVCGDSPHCTPPTPQDIRDEADRRIADLPTWGAQMDLRFVDVCRGCNKYRWGRQWRDLPTPIGYATYDAACPKCAKKGLVP